MRLAKIVEEIYEPEDSLGISRADMPQIDGKHMAEFLSWLRLDKGILYESREITASELTPSQSELDTEKAEKIFKDGGTHEHPIIVSKDNYVLDGHHRWLAVINHEQGGKIKCYQLSLEVKEALELMHGFSKAKKRDIDDEVVEMKLAEKVILVYNEDTISHKQGLNGTVGHIRADSDENGNTYYELKIYRGDQVFDKKKFDSEEAAEQYLNQEWDKYESVNERDLRADLKYRIKADKDGKFDLQYQTSPKGPYGKATWMHIRSFDTKPEAQKYLKDNKVKESAIDEMAERKTGKIMWVSYRDENGIVVDKKGNEHYFDSSVAKEFDKLKRNDEVTFMPRRAGSVLVARNVVKI